MPSLQDNYASGVFGGSLGAGKCQALIMIDFAQAYFNKDSSHYYFLGR